MTNRTSFYITRAFIGACEGGFIPGTILFATYFYKTKELAIRLACFWSTLNVARVISALLAAGILEMRGISGKSGWFWLFLIEGLLTFLIGAIVSPCSPLLWGNAYNQAELFLSSSITNLYEGCPFPKFLVHRARRNNHDKCCSPRCLTLFEILILYRESSATTLQRASLRSRTLPLGKM